MRIGITYDLRSEYLAAGFSEDETAEFDRPDTIAALERTLRKQGHETDRIGHARQLIARLAVGDDWDLVVNIAEGLEGVAREAQIPAILDVYGIPYTFSDPLVMALTLHKGLTKTVVRDGAVPTAPFTTIHSLSDVQQVQLPFPLFVKPVAEGTGKGISPQSIVRSGDELQQTCRHLLATYSQPVLVETFLPGREFTTGIIGTGPDARAIGTLEIILRSEAEPDVYSYVNKEKCEELVEYRLVSALDDHQVRAAEEVALQAWSVLGCRDAGRIDLRCNAAGQPLFLEVNPLAGLHPEHSDLPILASKVGWTYDELVAAIVASAAPRVAASNHSKARRWGREAIPRCEAVAR
jgi:D-alanine-D-alanine ligase